ncbi:hypothetical protein O6P43_004277, partial [Quillaja saponaria]
STGYYYLPMIQKQRANPGLSTDFRIQMTPSVLASGLTSSLVFCPSSSTSTKYFYNFSPQSYKFSFVRMVISSGSQPFLTMEWSKASVRGRQGVKAGWFMHLCLGLELPKLW